MIATPPPTAEMLEISGDDATTFLHAQLSSDVRVLEAGRWQWSAWLDAQGRVRALLQLARVDDTTYLALLRGGAAADMAAALGRYVLRAR
ncbi:MAG: folate-binding protein, partial [Metallibacterium scheffleri]|nr:folate-binding protein [Metallibacterium scheffleri]